MYDKTEFHILNGDFALELWKKSRSGANLVWKETYIEGPLPQTDDLHIFRSARAEYLATFAELENLSAEKLYRHLQKMDASLLELPENTRLVLWFDACIFDQTILMRLLYLLNRRKAALPEVQLYCCDGNCLTEKDFKEGKPLLLRSSDVKLGEKAWRAFAAKAPEELVKLADTENFERLPALKKALQRCAEEIPDQENLTRTQRQILQILSQKSCSFAEIFKGLDEFEEYPFLGDTACQRLLNDLTTRGRIQNIAPDLYCLQK